MGQDRVHFFIPKSASEQHYQVKLISLLTSTPYFCTYISATIIWAVSRNAVFVVAQLKMGFTIHCSPQTSLNEMLSSYQQPLSTSRFFSLSSGADCKNHSVNQTVLLTTQKLCRNQQGLEIQKNQAINCATLQVMPNQDFILML